MLTLNFYQQPADITNRQDLHFFAIAAIPFAPILLCVTYPRGDKFIATREQLPGLNSSFAQRQDLGRDGYGDIHCNALPAVPRIAWIACQSDGAMNPNSYPKRYLYPRSEINIPLD